MSLSSSNGGFGSFIRFEEPPKLANPPATVRRDKQGIPIRPSEVELNDIRPSPSAPLPSARDAPPNDVERSTPPTPTTPTGVDLLQTFTNPPMNKYRMASSTFMNFANGVNDSAPGALIPYLEAAYSVNYAVVSLIFISNALGFIVAAPLTHAIEARLGRARTHQVSLSILALAYVALLCAPPFPVIVISFFFLGFGMAVSLSLNNVFCVGLANATAALGFLHGAYGVGGTIGPLIATALASNGVKWSYFYAIPLFFALSNITAATFAYRNYEADAPAAQLMTALEQTASRQQADTPTRMQTLKLAARNKTTILGALFIFAYQGAEVSIASWLVSFLISYRHGDAGQVGYVSSGFWLGITLGRIFLSPQAARLGEKTSVVLLVACSLILQVVFWSVPNIIGNAVAISIQAPSARLAGVELQSYLGDGEQWRRVCAVYYGVVGAEAGYGGAEPRGYYFVLLDGGGMALSAEDCEEDRVDEPCTANPPRQWHPPSWSPPTIHINFATAFLYLFLSLSSPESPGFIYTLRSTIPIGAGLGSSASVCVCLSAALRLQIRTLAGPHSDQLPAEAETQIQRINRWAFVGELCIHGDPSGVDNAVSAGGKAVVFQRNEDGVSSVTPLPAFPKLPLLLVATQQPRSTATQVENVGRLKRDIPVMTDLILDGIGQLTTSALELISTGDFSGPSVPPALEHLGTLIRMNHGFLVSLGVSHPRLERIRELVDYADIGWTKLTGAGGGGCAITLFRPDVKKENIEELELKFEGEGFKKYETVLGGEGVGVLWPAVFRGADGEGKEIDQEKFESAGGMEGIEELVGVGAQESRTGWKFWTRPKV
ncbi:hypothetical protein V494_03733 [Pseudogymnoascus sp. VKM F-4513 (FW-928)]|nr:hypothetical protein V494_03733 [Pseudogymnoascus sp. VKM F-4513 (FW-928)]